MLTYRLQPRVFRIEPDHSVEYPAAGRIEARLLPAGMFGGAKAEGRFLLRGSGATIEWNANSGRGRALSHGELKPLKAGVQFPNAVVRLEGNLLIWEGRLQNHAELESATQVLLYVVPPLLALEMPEPPYVERITGVLGDVVFEYMHADATIPLAVVSQDSLERAAVDAIDRLPLALAKRADRALAAAYYLHVANRLLAAGYSQWEFMAEAVLNFDKSLRVLFGHRRDEVRRGLRNLGFGREQIEDQFVPILLLRSKLDVAHPRLLRPSKEQRLTIYDFLVDTPQRMNKVLKRALAALTSGDSSFIPAEMRSDPSSINEIDALCQSMKDAKKWDQRPYSNDAALSGLEDVHGSYRSKI